MNSRRRISRSFLFVPHELKQLPVRRGADTVYLRCDDNLKRIEKAGNRPFTVTLTNGKQARVHPRFPGRFRGESNFGQVELPLQTSAKVVFE